MGGKKAAAAGAAAPAPKGSSKGRGKAGEEDEAQRPFSVLDLPDLPRGVLPPEVELARTRVICGPDFNSNTEDFTSSHTFMAAGVDNSFTLEDFKRGFSIQVVSLEQGTLKFEMQGCSPAVANALRRILLAEVPTVAIEHVFVVNNTSVIYDEVLSHRLGLVPLNVDPRLFEFRGPGEPGSESNTAVFRLKVKCRRPAPGEGPGSKMVVTSDQLEWLPHGSELPEDGEEKLLRFGRSQSEVLSTPACAVDADIVLAKLAPGQEIELEAHAVKGLGKTHAKWSPVGTAWYDLCPEVVLLQRIAGPDAAAFLEESHPAGWDAQRPGTGVRFHGRAGGVTPPCFVIDPATEELVVANPRGCWFCLEKLRHMSGEPRWAGRVQVRRVKQHYLFTIESVGQLAPEELFTEAVKVLRDKCTRLMQQL